HSPLPVWAASQKGKPISSPRYSRPGRDNGWEPVTAALGPEPAPGTDVPGRLEPAGHIPVTGPLLDCDGRASALERGHGLVGRLLVDVLKQRLGRAVHQVLGLLQAEAGQGADLPDDLDLLVAPGLEA